MAPPAKPTTTKPFATVTAPQPQPSNPITGWKRWMYNNVLQPWLGAQWGIDWPRINEEGMYDEKKILELMETLPPNISEAMDKFVEAISPRINELVAAHPDLTFDELKNYSPNDLGIGSPENLSSMVPSLAQSDFAPIAQEAQRRFSQETVPGIMSQLTGLGQNAGSSAFAGSIGQAGSDLQSKLAALESQHNLEKGRLQLGQGELGSKLYDAASRRAGIMGGLASDQNRLGLQRAESLGRMQLGQQGQQLQHNIGLLGSLSNQMNRPTTGYQPANTPNYWADFGQNFTQPAMKTAAKLATTFL